GGELAQLAVLVVLSDSLRVAGRYGGHAQRALDAQQVSLQALLLQRLQLSVQLLPVSSRPQTTSRKDIKEEEHGNNNANTNANAPPLLFLGPSWGPRQRPG